LQFLLFTEALKNKNKTAFALEKEFLKEAKKLKMLSSLTGSGEEELKTLWLKVWSFISQPIFSINDTPISILKLFITLLIFIIGFILGTLYKRKIKNITYNSKSFTTSTRTLLANIGYYLIVLIAFFIALNVLGVKLSSLAVVAGALSVGIGFGLQNVVSNFVSGVILMFERSVKIGDFIQLDDNLRGYISDIRMRSTTITTNENIDVIIPNQKLIENNVINWTMSDNIRRFSVPFGVAYGTDAHIVMTEMADSSVNFELLVWVRGDLREIYIFVLWKILL